MTIIKLTFINLKSFGNSTTNRYIAAFSKHFNIIFKIIFKCYIILFNLQTVN